MNAIEARRRLSRIDAILANRERPLTPEQTARIASLKKDAAEEEDPEIRDILYGFKSKVQTFNRIRNRKLNTLVKGLTGQSLMQMKVKDLLKLAYGLADLV